jgi:hypothetical protein
MIGIATGHWFHGAEFTATSMIGMIALGGIIVRQSILIVEFVKIEVESGVPVIEAAVNGAEIRMRPIFITSLTLMAGAFAILSDPIFNGMAISLLWGAAVGTIAAVLIIPLGCISCRENFYYETSESCERVLSQKFTEIEGEDVAQLDSVDEYKTPLWMRAYSLVVAGVGWVVVIGQMVFNLLRMVFGMVMAKFSSSDDDFMPPSDPSPAPSTPPSSSTPPATSAPATSEAKAEPKVKKSTVTKRAATKKATTKKATPKKKTAVKKAAVKKSVTEKTSVKKAPSKKSSPNGRRGIRLKNNDDDQE